MTILSGDIKLMKSQVMLDVVEGGGAPTGNAIVDAVSNSIFPDISELDRALGRVNLRKVFVAVNTANTDQYFGANVIVADPPDDPLVSVTLFSTGQTFDTRTNARDRVEAYLAQGPVYAGYLFGDHIAGMAQITLLQRAEQPLPVVGDTLLLRAFEGAAQQVEQYVRVTTVASLQRTFSDGSGDFQRMQVACGISDTLRYDLPGFDALRYDAAMNYTGKTKTYTSIVADAARYFGVVALDAPAAVGDFGLKATGIYTQIVPSTRIEVPIADARLNQQSATLVDAGAPYTRTLTLAFTSAQALYVGGSILPGSLSVTRGGVTLSDKGGRLIDASASVVGDVDYANGVLRLATNVFGAGSGAHTVVYKPAMRPTLVTDAFGEPVTVQGQRLSYTYTFNLIPARGTLQVAFRVKGRWYVLADNGAGELRGADSSFGAGMLNFATGTLTVTLGALPDVGSSVIYSFQSASVSIPIQKLNQAGPSLPRAFGKVVSVGQPIAPGSIALAWNDGAARTATDLGGGLTGDATGWVNYATGDIVFRPTVLPAKGTAVTLALNKKTLSAGSVPTLTDGGANWTFSIAANCEPGTVEIALVVYYDRQDGRVTTSIRLFDDGAGNLITPNVTGNLTVGSITYASGACSVPKSCAGYIVADWRDQTPTLVGAAGWSPFAYSYLSISAGP